MQCFIFLSILFICSRRTFSNLPLRELVDDSGKVILQSGLRNTDGLVAHGRANSPQMGYYEVARLWATSPERG